MNSIMYPDKSESKELFDSEKDMSAKEFLKKIQTICKNTPYCDDCRVYQACRLIPNHPWGMDESDIEDLISAVKNA